MTKAKQAAARSAAVPLVVPDPAPADGSQDKSGEFFGFPCLCCGTRVPLHVESSGFVVACPDCRMYVRIQGQVIRRPFQKHLEGKHAAAYECGMVTQAQHLKVRGIVNKDAEPSPQDVDSEPQPVAEEVGG